MGDDFVKRTDEHKIDVKMIGQEINIMEGGKKLAMGEVINNIMVNSGVKRVIVERVIF